MTVYTAGRLEGHGNDYQRLLAWALLQRLMLGNCDFKLAFEMEDAGKFDDIGVLISGRGWHLVQSKHMQALMAERGKKLTKETLYDKKDNNFMLVKYYKSYKEKKAKWTHGEIDRVIIFTNREFDMELEYYREIKLDSLLTFSKGRHVQLVDQEEELIKLLKEEEIDRDIIKEFFSKLVLSVEQPNVEELRQEMNHEGRLWIQTWIRPDDLGRMSESFYEIPLNIIKKHFEEYEKPKLEMNAEGIFVNMKECLLRKDAQHYLEEMKEQIHFEVLKCSKRSCASLAAISHYYINRTISFSCEQNFEMLDYEFVNQMFAAPLDQRCFVFAAPPGMGKSTLLQHLAFEVQKKYPDSAVFLIYLNNFQDRIPEIGDIQDILNLKIFKSELAIENVKLIVENTEKQIVIFFDAFDELGVDNQKQMIKLFDVLSRKDNIKLIISGRMQVQQTLKTHMNAISVGMRPFDIKDQFRFFEKFWQVRNGDGDKFQAFADKVLAKFNTDLSHQEQDFVGVPLMTRMVAEIFAEPFEHFLTSNVSLDEIIPEANFSVVDLFENFAKKSIQILMNKKFNVDNSLELNSLFLKTQNDVNRDYQLFAAEKIFDQTQFMPFTANRAYHEQLYCFKKTFHHLQSLLFETTGNFPRFTHKLFMEYFAAKHLFEIFGEIKESYWRSAILRNLRDHENVRHFFLTMINAEISGRPGDNMRSSARNRLRLLADLGEEIIVWSCQRDYLNLTKQLHSLHNAFTFEKIRDDKGKPLLQVTFESGSEKVDQFLKEIFREKSTCKYPLHIAVESDRLDVVEQFLNKRNINSIDDNGNSPLLLAKSAEIFVRLFENHASLDVLNKDNETVLNKLVTIGEDVLVEALIEVNDCNGFDIFNYVDFRNNAGEAPLHIAAKHGKIELVKLLIEGGNASVDLETKNGKTALDLAIENAHIEVVRYLLMECNAEETEKFYTVGMSEYVSKVGKYMNQDPESVLKIIDTCLGVGMDLNSRNNDGYTALHRMAEHDGLEILKILIGRGSTIDLNAQTSSGWTPLHKALLYKSYNIAEFLITQDIDLSLTTSCGKTVLYFAVRSEDNRCVDILIRKYLEASRSLDEETRSGETALYIAAEQGNEANVRLLLQAGANVSKIDFTKLVGMWSGYTDLHYMVRKIVRSAPAIFLGLLDKIDTSLLKDDTLLLRAARLGCDKPMKILIDAGLNVNCKDQLGQTPLHIAVRNDHPEVVKYLIDGGADVDCQDVNGRTPLHFCRQAEIFRQLISADAKVNLKDNDGNSVLHFAAQNKCTELVEHFVNEYPNDINCKNKFDKTALHIAVEYNHEVIVELLVNSNADINAVDIKGKSPIFSALKFTNKVRDFLKKDLFKRYFQQPDRYRAELAAFNWFRVVTVESLLNMGASIHVLDEQRRSLLHVAAKSGDNLGNYQAVKVLINAGLDVNAEDEQKNIPLHYACLKTGKCDIVSYLIEFSSNVNHKNAKGQTPLHLAITDNNSADVTKLLIVKRANLILADDDGNTPLHLAILYRKTEIALLLIDLLDKPSLNGRNNDEETALHVAVLQNNIAVVRKLTEKRVKLSLRTEYNKTAWDIAVDENRHEIIAYFKNKLNNVSIG